MLDDRLVALRDDLRRRLSIADAPDAGVLAILADVETVLAALACEALPSTPNEAAL